MKKLALLASGMLLTASLAVAQGNGQTTGNGTGNYNGPMWRLDGNAGTDVLKPHFIGTTDNMHLAFRTDNVEHVRITASGDVGIGIDVPLAKLHVVGDAIIDGLLNLSGDLDVGGNLSVAGNTLLAGTLGVTGATSLSSDLSVGGNTSMAGTLAVTGASSFSSASLSSDLSVGGNTTMAGTLAVTGATSLSSASLSGNLAVAGNTSTSTFKMKTGAVSGYILRSDASGNASWVPLVMSWSAGTNTLSINPGNSVNLSSLDNGWVYGTGTNLYYTGNVAIGANTYASGYALSVDGKVACEEVLVDMSGNWPDYVFATDYELMPLSDLRTYIAANSHLPGVPSAVNVQENGIELGEMQRTMMEKIEELTLYILQQQETIDALKAEVDELKSSMK